MKARSEDPSSAARHTEEPRQSPIEDVLRLACRAPSVHNTQPWLWRIDGHRIDLFADLSRRLPGTDPDGRDLVLSCGAALHHVQVAARGLGWRPEVRRLPDPADTAHLATITLSPSLAAAPAVEQLGLLERRQTDRRRFTSWSVPPERLSSLVGVALEWGIRAVVISDEVTRASLRALTRRADQLQRDDPGYLAELESAIRRDGEGLSPDALPTHGGPGNRTFPAGALADPSRDPIGNPEGLVLLCTPADDTYSRLRAGEAMSAVWLQATHEGLTVVPLSQAMEVQETRRAVAVDLLQGWGWPQIVLRIGWPPIVRSDLPLSRRRDLDDVLIR